MEADRNPKPDDAHAARRSSGSPAGRSPARAFAIIGPDGAGKTTILREIAATLHRRGVRTRISWMRSPRIVTLAAMGLLRISRLARTIRMGDHDDVLVDLSRHPLLLHLYAWSVTFDYFLGYFGKVTIPRRALGRTILLDRFAWDTLVDLGLASGLDEGILRLPQGRILLDLARTHESVLVIASPEELIRRKPILSLDPRLPRRLLLYETLARRFGLGIVDSGTTTEAASVSAAARFLGLPAS